MSRAPIPATLRQRPSVLDISPSATKRIVETLREAMITSGSVALVSGPGPTARHALALAQTFIADGFNIVSMTTATGLEAEAIGLGDALALCPTDTLVVGVGGGSVLDVAKLAARVAGLRAVSVPTNLAHDGICSPVSSLRTLLGERVSIAAVMPTAVVIDLDVIAAAPRRSLVAGVGDLLSNFTAAMDWQLAAMAGRDKFKRSAVNLADRAARPALYGPIDDDKFIADLAHGLVMSGIAMGIAGSSRPCSGSEHLISHGLDHLLGPRAAQHGLQVALGTLLSAAAHNRYLPELQARFVELGLPLHPRELGITTDEFAQAIQLAPMMRTDRYTILDTLPLSDAFVHELMQEAFVQPGVQQAS